MPTLSGRDKSASYHAECITRIEASLRVPLAKSAN